MWLPWYTVSMRRRKTEHGDLSAILFRSHENKWVAQPSTQRRGGTVYVCSRRAYGNRFYYNFVRLAGAPRPVSLGASYCAPSSACRGAHRCQSIEYTPSNQTGILRGRRKSSNELPIRRHLSGPSTAQRHRPGDRSMGRAPLGHADHIFVLGLPPCPKTKKN
jgi:hypothetical protein